MNRPFEFAAPGRIVFGAGVRRQAGELALGLGRRALVVTGGRPERTAFLLELLSAAGVEFRVFSVPGEPTLETAREGTALSLEAEADIVIGIGGGSAMDAAKAVGVLAANGEYFLKVKANQQTMRRQAEDKHRKIPPFFSKRFARSKAMGEP